MKKIVGLFLVLMLFVQPLCALGEAAPPPPPPQAPSAPVISPEEAAYAERMKEAFQISVKYGETDWDSLLEATITVTWPGTGNIGTAENVNVHIGVKDGLYISAGQEDVFLGNMTAGQSVTFGVNLGYDKAIEAEKRREGKKPEPRLTVTVYAGNTDYTRYTAILDGMTEPRVFVVGADPNQRTPVAIENDTKIIKEVFSGSYYNGERFEVEVCPDTNDFLQSIMAMSAWDTDDNDVSYIYINAHGPTFDGEELDAEGNPVQIPLPAFEINMGDFRFVYDDVKYENVMPYALLLQYLNEYLKGRVVIITDVCLSGQLINEAENMGISTERFSIFTSSSGTEYSWAWPEEFEKLDVFDWFDLATGMYTSDFCRHLEGGYAKGWDGVTRAGDLAESLRRIIADQNQIAFERFVEDVRKGEMPDLGEVLKREFLQFKEKIGSGDILPELGLYSDDNVVENLISAMISRFYGNPDTLIYCDDPAVDDDKRRLVLIEEKLELLSPVELYYAYLREEVVPEIGVAAVNSEVRGDEGYDAAHWSRLNATVGGLLSAAVCDLDRNGTPDMLTIEVNSLPEEQISVGQRYFAVDLRLYQIVNGEVLMNDVVEDVIWVNERNRTCSSQTNFRLTEYEGQMMLECWASFTDGLSYDGGMNGFYGFKDGFFTDPPARPGAYDFNYFTADGRAYSPSLTVYEIGYQPDGSFAAKNMGEFIAYITYIPYFYPNHPGYVYYAGEITKLEEYLNEYEEEDYFAPLSYVGQPLPTQTPAESAADLREAAVREAIEAAAAPYQERMEQARFRCSVSCKKDGDLSQIMISIGQTSAGAIDTGLLRELCAALVSADGAGLPEEAASMVGNFEFKKGKSKTAGLVEMEMNQKPSGEFVVTITNDRARK